MYIAIHVPMFGSANVESKPIECPNCGRGAEHGVNDWMDRDISVCDPGDVFVCARCGKTVIINWGLVEPDHLSSWKNSEHCPHRLCIAMKDRLRDSQLANALNDKSPTAR